MRFTLLTSADEPKKNLVKVYTDDPLNAVAYDHGYKFDAIADDFTDISNLYEIVKELETDPHSCIIRAQPINEVFKNEQRLEAEHNGSKRTLEDLPLDWICLDLDDALVLPADIEQHEIPEFIVYSTLPEIFHNADYVFQFSGSAGLTHWTKGHYFFLIDTPADSVEMKRWAKVNPYCDPAMFKAIQPHYTATPLFTGTVTDPVNQRTFLKIKNKQAASIIIPTIEVVEQIDKAQAAKWSKQTNTNANGYNQWRVYLDQIQASCAHTYVVQAASSYHAIFGSNADWGYFISAYMQKAKSVGHKRANLKAITSEVNQILLSIRKFKTLNKRMSYDTGYFKDKIRRTK